MMMRIDDGDGYNKWIKYRGMLFSSGNVPNTKRKNLAAQLTMCSPEVHPDAVQNDYWKSPIGQKPDV